MTMMHLIRMTHQNDLQMQLGYDTVCYCLRVLACCRLALLLATAHQADRQEKNLGWDTVCVFQRLCLPRLCVPVLTCHTLPLATHLAARFLCSYGSVPCA